MSSFQLLIRYRCSTCCAHIFLLISFDRKGNKIDCSVLLIDERGILCITYCTYLVLLSTCCVLRLAEDLRVASCDLRLAGWFDFDVVEKKMKKWIKNKKKKKEERGKNSEWITVMKFRGSHDQSPPNQARERQRSSHAEYSKLSLLVIVLNTSLARC